MATSPSAALSFAWFAHHHSALPLELPLVVAVSNAACQSHPRNRPTVSRSPTDPDSRPQTCTEPLYANADEASWGIFGVSGALDSALYVFEELAAGRRDDDFTPGQNGSV
eukprot:680964-Pyramimonas_sp.AAC.1